MTTNPLPTHDTRVAPPPPGGVHLIDYLGDEIFMKGWDGEAPQPISLYADSDFSRYTHGQQVSRPFRLFPDDVPRQTTVSPVYLQHVPSHLLIDLLVALMLEMRFRGKTMRFCASCAPLKPTFPFGAY